MSLFLVIFLALALSMDSFAVCIALGASNRKVKIIELIILPVSIGIFHIFMIYSGWLLGKSFSSIIINYDHWIAFSLLGFVGLKMIYESIYLEKEINKLANLCLSTVLLASLGTSIDALVIGFSFPFLEINLTAAALIIGLVTTAMSAVGVIMGRRIGHFFEKKIEIFGGLILIGIGVKILIEHLS